MGRVLKAVVVEGHCDCYEAVLCSADDAFAGMQMKKLSGARLQCQRCGRIYEKENNRYVLFEEYSFESVYNL